VGRWRRWKRWERLGRWVRWRRWKRWVRWAGGGLVVREVRWWLNENNLQIITNYSTAVEHFSLKIRLGWKGLK